MLNYRISIIFSALLLAFGVYTAALNASDLPYVINEQVLKTICNAAEVPGLQSEEFNHLREGISDTWTTLFQQGAIEIEGKDQQVRPYFVALQGIVEHVLASELQNTICSLKGIIHTPMPATPLCTRGEVSKELVDPSIEMDPMRLFTVKARTTIIRDYLFKGGDLYVVYPKEGLYQRTAEQQLIYKQELNNYPTHLFDRPLDCEAIPKKLVGATYLFQDNIGATFVFAIQMTQAKNPQEQGEFGLWFGSIDNPAIQGRLQDLSPFLQATYCKNIFP